MTKKIDSKVARDFMLKNHLIPLEEYKNSTSKWHCRCAKCGEAVSPTLSNIKSGHSGCGYCAGNLISEKRIKALLKANHLTPLVKYPGTTRPWNCRCLKCGKAVAPHLGSLIGGQGGCIYCAGRKVDASDAIKLFKAKGFIPLTAYPGGNKPWLSRCTKCKFEISPTYSGVKRGVGCKICGRKEIPAKIAMARWKQHDLKPLVQFPGTTKPWKSECLRCHKVISPWYSQPTCKYCAKRAVLPADAIRLMKKSNLIPLEKYPGAMKPWMSKCAKCNKVVRPTYSSIRIGQGCKFCANRGFQYNSEAIIYLLSHPVLEAHKIGIAGKKRNNSRLKDHEKEGWIVLNTLDFKRGEDAYFVEQQVLLWLRLELGFPQALTKRNMPQSGFTETVTSSLISSPQIWRKVQKLARSCQ